mgnify:CR=1 FL=1
MRIDDDKRNLIILSLISAIVATCIILVARSWGNEPQKVWNNHEEVLHQILILESGNRNVPCGYSTTCTEIGIAQFKPSTWTYFQRKSGMHFLSIYEADDQIAMLNWALLNGYGNHWTTYRKAQERAIMGKYIKLK